MRPPLRNKNCFLPLWFVLSHLPCQVMTLKRSSHFCSPKCHKYDNLHEAPYIVSPIPSPTMQTTLAVYSIAPGLANSSSLPWHTNKHFLKFKFIKSYKYSYVNLKELYNQAIKLQVTIKDVKREDSLCMKCPTPELYCARMFFIFNPLFVLLTFQMLYQSQAEHDPAFATS